MPAECRVWLRGTAPEERPMRWEVQGCKYREGAVRRLWGSFLDSSGAEKGILNF